MNQKAPHGAFFCTSKFNLYNVHMHTPEVYIIVAVDSENGIGKDGKLPWHLKKEMAFFTKTTKHTSDPHKQNAVMMGRTTWESITEKYRPLPDRKNIVLTHRSDYEAPGAEIAHSIESALQLIDSTIERVFIIGGAEVFKEVINAPYLTGIYLTQIHKKFDCDTHFPQLPEKFTKGEPTVLEREEEDGVKFECLLFKV